MSERPEHSPLGASGAERWMHCPGSIALLEAFNLPETEEPAYRSEGTTAHEGAYKCLSEGLDSWEIIGQTFGKHEFTSEMSIAVQDYLDACRRVIAENPGGEAFYEQSIDFPEFHPYFYGTTDFAYVVGSQLFIRDFKYGIGLAVDVEDNVQTMYYAFGVARKHEGVKHINLGIVQPRAFHPDGPIRTWEISDEALISWAYETLRPAMERALLERDFVAGSHCRFCPAKLICPLMKSLFGAAAQCNPDEIHLLSTEDIGRSYALIDPVKFYLKALQDETLRRLTRGAHVEGVKLVPQKADRVFKDGAEQAFRLKFGSKAFTEPSLRSPAQMEKLGTEAKTLVKSWAYTPQTGYTVAPLSDKRAGIVVQSVSETFAADLAANQEK